MFEPKRYNDIDLLWDPFRDKVKQLLINMRVRGYDPVLFETFRTEQRQRWLYNRRVGGKRVTWTMESRHRVRKAADIISKKRLWDWPEFYFVLRKEAEKLGLKVLDFEQCHIEWK